MTATVVIDRTPIQPQLPASSPHLLERLKIRKPGATKSRVAGIDIARAVAMIGMLIAHTVLPQGGSGGSSASNPSADAVVEAVPHALSWEFLAALHEAGEVRHFTPLHERQGDFPVRRIPADQEESRVPTDFRMHKPMAARRIPDPRLNQTECFRKRSGAGGPQAACSFLRRR